MRVYARLGALVEFTPCYGVSQTNGAGTMAILSTIRSGMQHWFNSGHVYCRLRCVGCPDRVARRVALVWERATAWALYGRG